MIAVLKKLIAFNSRVAKFALFASGGLVASIAVVVAAGVFWRYVLNDSLSWTEEVSRYLLIWLAAIGSIVAMHRRELVAIELLPDALSQEGGRLLRILISVIVIGTGAVIAFYGWSLAVNAWGQSASTFRMPLFFVTVAIPVAAGAYVLMALEQALAEIFKIDGSEGAAR